MPDSIQALQNIPFERMIGGPLQAAVEAQALAAQSTIEFIEKVGFDRGVDPASTELRNVTFTYAKQDEGTEENFSLTVPLLAIVPIPFIRIDEINIEFNAKLNDSVQTDDSTNTSLNVGVRGGGRRFGFRAGFSRTRKSSTSTNFEAEYNMNIKVRAGASTMPEGMAKILDILEQVITETPVAAA